MANVKSDCPMCVLKGWAETDPEASHWAAFSLGTTVPTPSDFRSMLCKEHYDGATGALSRCVELVDNLPHTFPINVKDGERGKS